MSVAATAPAQTRPPRHHEKDKLQFTLILSRHGVRPPLATAASLNARSSDPWPIWEVPLGYLTPHGAAALTQLGLYLRADFAQTGLLPAGICPRPADVYLYADTDERNIESTRATFAAFGGPQCAALPIYTWKPPLSSTFPASSSGARPFAPRDPNFLPLVGHVFPPPPADASLAAMQAALGPSDAALGASAHPELTLLAQILSPSGSSHPAAQPLLADPVVLNASPTGEPMVDTRGPALVGSTLVEDLALEYEDGKPLSDVGWGRLSTTDAVAEAALHRLIPLHVAMFGLAHRTPYFARAESSNLLAHILDTLQQAAVNRDLVPAPKPGGRASASTKTTPPDRTPTVTVDLKAGSAEVEIDLHPSHRINGAFGPAGTKLVYISAHDTNLAGVAGLLGLHWVTPDGTVDDIPPDAELVFELWQEHHKVADDWPFQVHIRYRAQTLGQLRAASPLTAQAPPVEVDLKPVGCKSAARGCTLAMFLHAARATIDRAYTQLDVPPTQRVPDR